MSTTCGPERELAVLPATRTLRPEWEQASRRAQVWIPPVTRTVVVVPHPDDESLSTGGLISFQRRRGLPVTVVAVTDGEAAYTGLIAPDRLGRIRRGEQTAALAALGIERRDTPRLGMPDGELADSVDELSEAIADVVHPGDLVIAPWRSDHHPDHRACAVAAEAVSNRVAVTLLGGLFWAYHHSAPPQRPSRLLRLELDADLRDRRAVGIAAHRSQFPGYIDTSILNEELVSPARRTHELFVSEPS